ncbi:MAG: hypothetical protein QCI82_06735 [Candidatus Thermoplasmatota archaeon]|nr:hypothetical protein [Candidatus Thermoplasmatota archaeon]
MTILFAGIVHGGLTLTKVKKIKGNNIITILVLNILLVLLLPSFIPLINAYWTPPSCGDLCNYYRLYPYDIYKMGIAEYNFNEGSGSTTHDDSGRGKTGSVVGAEWVDERDNNFNSNAALSFDGNGDYVEVEDHPDLEELWNTMFEGFVITSIIRIPDECEKQYMSIVSQVDQNGVGYNFHIDNGNLALDLFGNLAKTDGIDLRNGIWHFIAVTFYWGKVRFYIDPTTQSDGFVSEHILENFENPSPTYPNTNLYIGINFQDQDYDFEGIIDCVLLYKSLNCFTAPEYELPWGHHTLAYWTMDEGDGMVINDRVGWDWNSYGILMGSSFVPWLVGPNGLHFEGGYVNVPDYNYFFDFPTSLNQDDFYVEFIMKVNDFNPSYDSIIYGKSTLIGRYEVVSAENPIDLRGWEIYVTPHEGSNSQGIISFAHYNGSQNSIVTTYNQGPTLLSNVRYYVYAWSINGNQYLHVTTYDEIIVDSIYASSVGIGDPYEYTPPYPFPLFIGAGVDQNNDPNNPKYFYNGYLDELSIRTL